MDRISPTKEQQERIMRLGHQVQSGINALMSYAENTGGRFPEVEPKHLRVGVNSALIDAGTLVSLLVNKGVFTADEYFEYNILLWESEVESYRTLVKEVFGPTVDI